MLEALETLFYIAISVVSLWNLRDRLSPDPDPTERRLEGLKDKRARGKISETTFEQELELVLDDRNAQLRAAVEAVPGISTARSKALACEYESLKDLRASSRERLESVPDIGEQRAAAVLEYVRNE